jgi:Helix-turn-helix domain
MATKPWREIQARRSKHTPEQREATRARALRDLEIERKTLAQLRLARSFTQKEMAETAGMAQGDVSRLEHRTDAYIGTVRRFVEALGGKLTMFVEFPDAGPVELQGFGDSSEKVARG